MEKDGQYYFKFSQASEKFPKTFSGPTNSIIVYTVFSILRQMRRQLCLEAMLEYMEEYLETVEQNNPRLKTAVSKALSMISVKKMYKDAML